ncbi:cysteine--tRNA ligase [Candidatus Azambacteria bacterium]|nr:cysteine--tRNA ligase [Candidatus Azambacteria bacterium]MBI3685665.1 cysteine--tRNA ligase [Candidatus Azambacteria bacterium]
MLRIYNSRTRKKEVFKPREGKKVRMFVCGITPYDFAHIGNFKVFLNYDLLARYLAHRGYKVFYLQNVTDVDDKIVNAAKAHNKNWKEIADHYFNDFLAVCDALHITSVTTYAKATEHIRDIISQISRLVEKGYAYEQNGSVYFEVNKFKNYGKLSGQNPAKLHTSVRLAPDANKKHPYDFVLWKAREGIDEKYEPSWDSPWGLGRPGWHIEDTAISEHYFGPQYDIHGGAVELKFPHHEAEIAQAESASGKKPFVKYWVHAGILMLGKEKMSKSFGNVITGKQMLAARGQDAFRFLVAATHYRSPIPYSEKLLAQARTNLSRIREFARNLEKVTTKKGIEFSVAPYAKKFYAKMDDDLNAPAAFAAIFILMRAAHKLMAKEKLSVDSAHAILSFLEIIASVIGVPLREKESVIPDRVLTLANKREKARTEKNWVKADALRAEIEKEGYGIKDLADGFEIILKR